MGTWSRLLRWRDGETVVMGSAADPGDGGGINRGGQVLPQPHHRRRHLLVCAWVPGRGGMGCATKNTTFAGFDHGFRCGADYDFF